MFYHDCYFFVNYKTNYIQLNILFGYYLVLNAFWLLPGLFKEPMVCFHMLVGDFRH